MGPSEKTTANFDRRPDPARWAVQDVLIGLASPAELAVLMLGVLLLAGQALGTGGRRSARAVHAIQPAMGAPAAIRAA